MSNIKRPYLIIPELIEQPTWGGDYILQLKKWSSLPDLQDKKIGQTFELYGKSKLALEILDSKDTNLHNASSTLLEELVASDLSSTLGPKIAERFGKMPLLIKLNQAAGNSFQLHIKTSQTHPRWKAKPESWYFLEPGYISCGIKEKISIEQYKHCCVNIADKMRELSKQVQHNEKSIEDARLEAKEYIKEQNPWQYINLYEVPKHELIDLSGGGTHHSWEENREQFPLGNIVYEVQLDVMDEFCTIRGFDQGKMKDDGSIREIHVEDYFTFMDTSPESNNIQNLKRTRQGKQLLQTSYYSLDILEIESNQSEKIEDSFHHLYVQEGEVEIKTEDTTLTLSQGHSCFIPYAVAQYDVTAKIPKSILLKTYIKSP